MPHRYTTETSDEACKAMIAAGHNLVVKQFAVLERHLEGREWILDGGPSVIDAYAFPMIRWASAKLPGGLVSCGNVCALHDWLAADPVVQKVLAVESSR